jgi:hypothetical protein
VTRMPVILYARYTGTRKDYYDTPFKFILKIITPLLQIAVNDQKYGAVMIPVAASDAIMNIRVIPIIVFLAALAGCQLWKSTTLKPRRFAFIKNGSGQGEAALKIDEYGIEDLTIGVGVFGGMVCVADNDLKRLQIIKPDGEVELIIGSLKGLDAKNTPAEKFNFGSIGYFAIDGDRNLYVQNKFSTITAAGGADRDNAADSIDFAPSYILVFNRKGELQYTLGQKGTPDLPFYHIEKLSVDAKGRLLVLSRFADSWSIFRFRGRKRDFFVNLGTIDFTDKDPDEGVVYEGKIDNVKMFANGDSALISVTYYHGLRLKYIKIFEYSLDRGKTERVVLEIPDPKNVLFDIVDDRYLYLWNVENDRVKFEVANLEGAIINNVYMNLDSRRSYYTKIFLDDAGGIYSYHVLRSGVEIMRWE